MDSRVLTYNADARDAVLQGITVQVTLTGVRFALWRFHAAVWLLRLVRLVAGCHNIEVNLERSRRG